MHPKVKMTLNFLIVAIALLALILGTVLIFGGAIYLVIMFWDSFVSGFCKVSFVCWNDDPNWLGWILIGLLGLFLAAVCFAIWKTFVDAVIEEKDTWLT